MLHPLQASAHISISSPEFPKSVQPEDSLLVTFRFSPEKAMDYSGTVRIYSSDPDYPTIEISLIGRGELGEITVYPNPFAPDRGHDYIYFSKVPPGGKILVYDISGERLWNKDVTSGGTIQWDTKLNSGKFLPTGLYYYIIKDKNGTIIKRDKFSVIR